jgi:hypothetical protein
MAGHPAGRWNNKTLICFDSFMINLWEGVGNKTMDFELQTRQGTTSVDRGEERTIKVKGAYVIV